ncbi:glucose-6-phosphate dehydrogenase assembly protein OpcA [Prochlorococcus sp. MIT 1223]|uniref:glucose-6-phosphate dehydrogenase assembly protein OpcA n=1 Tax=Prochlorococcus sp. MIT 1223 TaxID=3096217 RepID=UPI002A747C12|nr:glucose-6-phosphate dehydrogenase assembly protein OpcA [Prochlorococcus sp. MIT 1223]
MSPQLTVQTPLQLPPSEIPSYLDQLWSHDEIGKQGANTFTLLVWQPAWMEQKLIRSGKVKGPILGNQRIEIIEAARNIIIKENLPHSTCPLDISVYNSLSKNESKEKAEDLRGQYIDKAISELQPRRLITLAPTLDNDIALETLVAAYCPLPEDGDGNSACGDVVVLRGNNKSLNNGLGILKDLIPEELPSWLWWNGSLDEAPDLLQKLALSNRRLIIDSALGKPTRCLELLNQKLNNGQAVNDLNWLRLRGWRETLAMVFDPLDRRASLTGVVNLDIDIEGKHPVQGLLLASWISDRLGWELKDCTTNNNNLIEASFSRKDGNTVNFRLMPLPIGNPSIHPGQIVGLRLICKSEQNSQKDICVILASESGECMRLEAGGMASMELIEEVVPNQHDSVEMDVARLLGSSRGTSSPLLEAATPIAFNMLKSSKLCK